MMIKILTKKFYMNSNKTIFYLHEKTYLQNIFKTLNIKDTVKLKYTEDDFENLISKISCIYKIEKLFYHLEGIIIPARENGKAIFSLKIPKNKYLDKILKDGI